MAEREKESVVSTNSLSTIRDNLAEYRDQIVRKRQARAYLQAQMADFQRLHYTCVNAGQLAHIIDSFLTLLGPED